MDISDIGVEEALNHWNGHLLARADKLGEASLDRHFGRNRLFVYCNFPIKMWCYRWNFILMANKADSMVIKRLREKEPSLPFFSISLNCSYRSLSNQYFTFVSNKPICWISLINHILFGDLRCFIAN